MNNAELVLQKTKDLPALPQVATRVMELAQDPEAGLDELEKVITRDQALTTKVLKIANSALFGVRSTISTVTQAIGLLGLRTLRSVVVAASTESLFRSSQSSFKDKILWEHSLAVALTARILAREAKYRTAEQAFVAGLIHDIGKTVMDANLGEVYGQVVERVYNGEGTFFELEQKTLGIDHCDVGALVAEKWNLAPELIESIRFHHNPGGATFDPKLSALICLANRMCVKLSIGPERDPDVDLFFEDTVKLLEIDPDQLLIISQTVEETLAMEKEMFSIG